MIDKVPNYTDIQSTPTPVDFDPFADGELQLTVPSTESQREIWATAQMGGEASCAFNQSVSLRLHGPLDLDSLHIALQKLAARHEVLRTTFSPDGLTMCVAVSANIDMPFEDLSAMDRQNRETQLQNLAHQEVVRPFDLMRGPLFRASVVRIEEQKHLVLFTIHHIVGDGWSTEVLLCDFGALYSSICQNHAHDLAPPTLFSEYARSQEQQHASSQSSKAEQYWLEQFSDRIPVLELPIDWPRPSLRTYNSARDQRDLNPIIIKGLRQVGAQAGCTFFTTFLAAFDAFLHRLTGQDDLVVGIPAAGQAFVGQHQLVGHCVNLLPLRSRISMTQPFTQYLRTLRAAMLSAYEHQQYTFGSLLKKLPIVRDASRVPLVSVVLNVDQAIQGLHFYDLEVEFFSNPRRYENFELALNAVESSTGLLLECSYNTDLFNAQSIRRRLEEFEVFLAGIVADANQPVAQIPVLPQTERHQLLAEWNPPTKVDPRPTCIHQRFEQCAEQTPNATTLVYADEHLTYRELNQHANALAHHLRGLGVGPETLVGLCVERSTAMLVGILGILKAGGAYVPLDPAYPQERLAFMLADTDAPVVVTQSSLRAKLPSVAAKVIDLDAPEWEASTNDNENPASGVKPENLAYVIYTSGSTGKPKGVQVTHANVTRLFTATEAWFHFGRDDVWTLFHSYAFDFSVWELWGALLYGGRLVVVPHWVSRTPEAFYKLLVDEGITVLNQTPSAFRQLIQAEETSGSNNALALRLVIFGGEALELASLKPWVTRHGDTHPQLVNMYGITETTVHVTYRPLTIDDIERNRASVIGIPIPDLQLYVLDPYRQPVPIGVAGELYVGGAGVARGYLNRPELTTERFVSHPFSNDPQARLYRTGDRVRYRPDRDLEYLGRLDHQVKIRGFRIELGEIEAVLTEHPDIREALVTTHEYNPGDQRLVAYLVPHGDDEPDLTILRDFLATKLPDYMVPSTFVTLAAFPLTENGKLDRQALPVPDYLRPDLAQAYVAPRSEVENLVATIWQEVIGVERVGIHDNFFQLGGHSLLAAKVVFRIREYCQVELPLRVAFEVPVLSELARHVEALRYINESTGASDEGEREEISF